MNGAVMKLMIALPEMMSALSVLTLYLTAYRPWKVHTQVLETS